MDTFRQCIEDLATIGRMLELPHGQGIAAEMLRELEPSLKELTAVSARDASGGVKLILAFAESLKTRLKGSDSRELKGGRQSSPARVA
jgi:hypothetical protein